MNLTILLDISGFPSFQFSFLSFFFSDFSFPFHRILLYFFCKFFFFFKLLFGSKSYTKYKRSIFLLFFSNCYLVIQDRVPNIKDLWYTTLNKNRWILVHVQIFLEPNLTNIKDLEKIVGILVHDTKSKLLCTKSKGSCTQE